MVSTELMLVILKFMTVVLGMYIVFLGFRAYQKQPSRSLFWMTLGMVTLTAGAISEGFAQLGFGWSLDSSHIFEALVTLAGFAVLVYSLVVRG